MRTYDSPYIADWFAISLRWITLVGTLASLALRDMMVGMVWPILLLLLWNVAMTFMAALNARLNYHRQVAIVVDVGLAALFFFQQDGIAGPVSWIAILPKRARIRALR